MSNLFTSWLESELRTKTLGKALEALNEACGTKYKHNWPSVMKDRGYTLERLPTNVRQYMMMIVLPEKLGLSLSGKELNELVKSLT